MITQETVINAGSYPLTLICVSGNEHVRCNNEFSIIKDDGTHFEIYLYDAKKNVKVCAKELSLDSGTRKALFKKVLTISEIKSIEINNFGAVNIGEWEKTYAYYNVGKKLTIKDSIVTVNGLKIRVSMDANLWGYEDCATKNELKVLIKKHWVATVTDTTGVEYFVSLDTEASVSMALAVLNAYNAKLAIDIEQQTHSTKATA